MIMGGSMPRQTALWLVDVGDTLNRKLVKAGLIDPVQDVEPEPEPEQKTLAQFLDEHVEHGRTSKGKPAAPSTLVKWRPTVAYLKEQFSGKLLRDITAEDAHQFRVWLDKRRIKQKTAGRKGKPMTENAKRRHIATCKMFFNAAKRRGLVESNPFEAQVSGTQPNRKRDYFVTPDQAAKLLNAAPDAQWRLLIALWRLAGLRKMEVFKLTWGDVLRDEGKLRVHSSKTAHLDGYDVRYVPIRDVREYLEDAFQLALPSGKRSIPPDAPIITRFSSSNSNLDKPFRLIVEAAGLVPWPKLFQNLRASCETQWLKDGERADLVANWIGHSVTVQRKNYVQHTDEDVDAFNAKPAFKGGNPGGNIEQRNGAKRPKVATQVATSDASKNTVEQRFSTSNRGAQINPART
jgi:integrase